MNDGIQKARLIKTVEAPGCPPNWTWGRSDWRTWENHDIPTCYGEVGDGPLVMLCGICRDTAADSVPKTVGIKAWLALTEGRIWGRSNDVTSVDSEAAVECGSWVSGWHRIQFLEVPSEPCLLCFIYCLHYWNFKYTMIMLIWIHSLDFIKMMESH